MNKNAIFNYVEYAREELQKLVKQKAFEYGITEKGADKDLLIVNGRLLNKEEIEQRKILINEIESKYDNKFSEGYEIVMEEVSYTWFNRFIALRFMEVNGYLPSRTRVFSDEFGKFNPQILKEALALDLYGMDRLKVSEMIQHNESDELFKYLLILQCNALSKPMPKMFEKISNYTELLFPNGLLKKGSIIDKLVNDIPEEDWKDQVQIIGWMYQFYISKKKDEVFASKKTITKNTIGAVTQLFTPDWIVRYMAENSIGRIWLESYPNSSLKSEMKYYVDDANQEEDVKQKLEELKYKNVEPENIKIIEPCCGSGHILVYCFDLLYKMYLEKGYAPKDIAKLILKNNLYALDVDKRAVQLAYFSVMMKARAIDRQYLIRDVVQQPNIYELLDSEQIAQNDYEELLTNNHFSEKSINYSKYLVSTFKNGKVIGSLLKVNNYDYEILIDEINEKMQSVVPNLIDQISWYKVLPKLRSLAQLAVIMSKKYDVMITNPPYLGSSSLEPQCKEYAYKFYPNSKNDMFSMFMETDFVKEEGYSAIINMHSWMFLSSYEKLRKHLLKSNTIINMAHLGPRAFESIGGEVVQTTAFVLKNCLIYNFNSKFIRLTNLNSENDKEKAFFDQNRCFLMKQNEFKLIPGEPCAYWVSRKILDSYKYPLLGDFVETKQGLKSSKDELFFRFWFELDNNKIDYGPSNKKWIMLNKGSHSKWADKNLYVINWEFDGKEIKDYAKQLYNSVTRTITSMDYYYKPSISWSSISSVPAFREVKNGYIFSSAGASMFLKDESQKYKIMALLNSKVLRLYTAFLNPTVNMCVTDMLKVPYIPCEDSIDKLVKENINKKNEEINKSELSRLFQSHPLIMKKQNNILECFEYHVEMSKSDFLTIKRNEEEINRNIIRLYQLDEEVNYQVENSEIDFVIPDKNSTIKSFISYLVGIVFGRYSLDKEGLTFAGGEWNPSLYSTIIPDENNIIPILDEGYFVDDLLSLLVKCVTKIYGKDTLEENLKFIADAIGENGTSKDIIRNYLLNGFYNDHLKAYQKRPIYWLFDAGKQNSFKALIYMHRYTPDLLAKMRTDYILPLLDKYSSRIEFLEKEIPTLSGTLAIQSRKELEKLKAQYKELSLYEPKIHHLADQRIEIDLDDGVKYNYELFKDVLAPIK